jgi:hypothetical protein
MEIVNPTTRRKGMIIAIKRRIRVKIRSKEREKVTEDTRKLMRILIITSTSMHQDLNTLESQSLRKLKCLLSLLRTRGKSSLISTNSTRK